MEIYLMQHGPNLSKDEDPEESLSPEGREQITIAARAIDKMALRFDVILSSPKKRSKQTAAIVAEAVGFPTGSIIETELVKAMVPAEETIDYLKQFEDKKAVLIAGHLPSLAEVAAALLTQSAKAAIKFERGGGIGRIDVESLPTHEGALHWYLTPDQLNLIGT